MPQTPISGTEVKRLIARRYVEEKTILIARMSEPSPEQFELLKSGYTLMRKYFPDQFRAANWPSGRLHLWSIGIGPEPRVKRINSRKS
jgi:hypothetical protein